jgi:hypothetical protein
MHKDWHRSFQVVSVMRGGASCEAEDSDEAEKEGGERAEGTEHPE